MTGGLLAGVLLLAFANGANDNFKGVATLWGTGRYAYRTALLWATLWTFAGSLLGALVAGGLVQVFNGSRFLGRAASLDALFLAAAALGAAVAVLIATRLGAPVSTTHALAGALVGAGLPAAGAAHLQWSAVATSIALPLLLSPLAALGLTLATFPGLARWIRSRSCLCVTEPPPILAAPGEAVRAAPGILPSLRIAHRSECSLGDELTRWNTEELVHWSSAALISLSRGMNDTPKITALALSAAVTPPMVNYLLVAAAMAIGGMVAARRVARTMAQRVTQIEPVPGMSANLVAAGLVAAASPWALPVSTTHVTMGAIFGVGFHRREKTNWGLVRQILLAWVVTMPVGLACGLALYHLLSALN